MQQEATNLRKRIERMENEKNAPLVDVGTGKSNTNVARTLTKHLIHDLIIVLVYISFQSNSIVKLWLLMQIWT